MKRYILSAVTAFAIITGLFSQNVDDALRYSQNFYGGTARAISMGNAFTSLGADLSALSLNPAGAGMFRKMEISITPQLTYFNSSSIFNGTKTTDYRYNFGIPQIGIVGSLISNDNSTGLVSLNFAYSYNQLDNYNENITMSGVSNNSSMADYWAGISNGKLYSTLTGGEGIAFDTYLMDTIPGSQGKNYATTFSHYGDSTYSTYGQTITRVITDEGYKGEHNFTLGANLSNELFLGATFGINTIHYIGHYDHSESDFNNVIYDFKNFSYTNHFEADGRGFAFKIGAIYRPVNFIRLGFAFHAPIGFRMHEYYYDNIVTSFDNGDKPSSSNVPQRYDYTLSTPMRLLGGISFQLKKFAILSADYEYIDYSQAKFSRAIDGKDYIKENRGIDSILTSASNLRFGAEFRFGSVYVRGGYGIYGSAFAKGMENENLTYNSISGGVGYRQNNFYIDFAYRNLFYTRTYNMYYDPGYLKPSTIKVSNNTFTATIGMKF